MPTIQEVANEAGVSTATVSRVLSNPDLVTQKTREKVMRVVVRLGYSPNGVAKSLRTFRTHKLLVTVPDIANPFFSLLIQGIEDAAQQIGYSVLLGDTRHDEDRESGYAQMLKRREADGLIFLGHRSPKVLADWKPANTPIPPVVNGCEFSPRLGVPSVHIDNESAAREMMDYLYDLGHRRIGVITGPLVSPLSRDRLKGAKSAARLRGLENLLQIVNGNFSIASGHQGLHELLECSTPPTAVFCFNDEMAVGAIHHARERGMKIPDDLSIAGFDDIQFSAYIDPALTTIHQPMAEIGREAVRLLMEILDGKTPRPKSITLPHHLVIRTSTASPREKG